MVISNIPISLIDTAGLRETSDTVESIGVERSRALMADADLVIVILDASEPITKEDHKILDSVRKFDFIVALNKIDKVPSWDIDRVIAGEHSSLGYLRPRITPVSAKSGEGIDALRDAIIKPFAPEDISNAGFLVSDARHHDLLLRTKSEIEDSVERLDERLSEEIVLIGLHNALRYLGDITGRNHDRRYARPDICHLLNGQVQKELRIRPERQYQSDPQPIGGNYAAVTAIFAASSAAFFLSER
ncbi:MAG: GTP-binding protein [Chloracidobacterium sp.]|nr:GTP-binding protein [Chloracidobacterium sp.]